MKALLIEIFTSKKALAAIAGVIIVVLNRMSIHLDNETMNQILALIASYIVGQGVADIGKYSPAPARPTPTPRKRKSRSTSSDT